MGSAPAKSMERRGRSARQSRVFVAALFFGVPGRHGENTGMARIFATWTLAAARPLWTVRAPGPCIRCGRPSSTKMDTISRSICSRKLVLFRSRHRNWRLFFDRRDSAAGCWLYNFHDNVLELRLAVCACHLKGKPINPAKVMRRPVDRDKRGKLDAKTLLEVCGSQAALLDFNPAVGRR